MKKTIETFINLNPKLKQFSGDIANLSQKIAETNKKGGRVLLCGNGGSASDCEHIAGELIKEFKIKRQISPIVYNALKNGGNERIASRLQGGIAAQSLVSQSAIFTAICNDVGYDMAFAQQLSSCGKSGDILFAFTTSGNSQAVLNAAIVARAMGIFVCGFTGEGGGKLKPLCNICFNVPSSETYLIQEMHLPLYHCVCACAESVIWGEKETEE